MTTSGLERQVEQRLRESGVRYTAGRHRVVSAMAGAEGPMSAAELLDRLFPEVPLSSLYRTLAVLEKCGVIAPHFGVKGVTRYELAEWLRGHHHHLVCIYCGGVEDIALPPDSEAQVRDLVDVIASSTSFTPLNHALEIEGKCPQCA